MRYSAENPWIGRREATVCLWKPDYNRGYISNMNTSLLVDFMCFSDSQLEKYALMMKACGFTGVQVTDMCSAWRPSGSPEFFHDRLKVFADALHRCGMEFTLWCWAAEFCDHGWHDEDVVYSAADGGRAFNDPVVRSAFEKYYNIYAEMAPYTDRVIAHFYDPGNLQDIDDVLDFLRLFADKFRAANPNVKIGVDTWGSPPDTKRCSSSLYTTRSTLPRFPPDKPPAASSLKMSSISSKKAPGSRVSLRKASGRV